MQTKDKPVTVFDVAERAGVSKGTVDRVLHNRSGVSAKSRAKVLEAVESLGYKTNINAAILSMRRHFKLICIIPQYRPGEYWGMIDHGVERSRSSAAKYNVEVETVYYNQYELEDFRLCCDKVLESKADGVVLAPLYREETRQFAMQLQEAGIPYVFFDSRLNGCDYLAYFGMSLYDSGQLCASLLTDENQVEEVGVFSLDRGHTTQTNPILDRCRGFMDYMKTHYPQAAIHNATLLPYDLESNRITVANFIKDHPNCRHLAMFNSRVHLLADSLAACVAPYMRVVGFDNIERNIQALHGGQIRFLIVQRAEVQVYNGIQSLIDYLILRQKPEVRDHYARIDILCRENEVFY